MELFCSPNSCPAGAGLARTIIDRENMEPVCLLACGLRRSIAPTLTGPFTLTQAFRLENDERKEFEGEKLHCSLTEYGVHAGYPGSWKKKPIEDGRFFWSFRVSSGRCSCVFLALQLLRTPYGYLFDMISYYGVWSLINALHRNLLIGLL